MEYNPDLPFYKRLHWQVLAAMILGSLAGVTFGEAGAEAIGWIGELFMRLLRMIIVPLVLTSIVSGVASVGGGRAVGRLFGKTLGYYVVSSFLAASVGLLMVNLIRPGVDSNIVEASTDPMLVDTPDSFIQLILDIVPINFVGAAGTGDMLAIIFFCIVFGAAITTLPERPRVIITDIFDAFF
ncbi:MAG: cation:dicarboxylase symporter family transporter, partial [Gammaproteobacteria bacterium]|nr:cation:dicarboxylase symporter family transporter [Gammaproteobacteria bacterium]